MNPPLDLARLLPWQEPVRLSPVPFYPQQDFHCGPAALAGVLGAAGTDADPAALAGQVYLPGRRGSLQVELMAATRRAGRIPYPLEGDSRKLFAQLRAGRPVLVLQNLGTRHFPAWHYAVLVGADPVANVVYLNSGGEQGLTMAAPAFQRTWDWAGQWALVTLRPGELPPGVDRARYIEAVAAFEAVAGLEPAGPAWRAALRAWPRDPRPYLALGNSAYAGGNLPIAADYYRRGLRVSPLDPALSNNLASVLGELGCPGEGTALLQRVQPGLPVDSPWQPVIAASLAELGGWAAPDAGFCMSLGP